jgi:hypothetical protein
MILSTEEGRTLMKGRSSIVDMLSEYYPDIKWDESRWKLYYNNSKSQMFLFKTIRSLFPTNVGIFFEEKLSSIRYYNIDRSIVLDIWIPSHNIAIEYHGSQHYFEDNFLGGKKVCNQIKKTHHISLC